MTATTTNPGPETTQFLISGIAYPVRVALILILIAVGFAVQFVFLWLWPGMALIAAGSILGSVRSVNSKPKLVSADTEWKEVLPQQWRKAVELGAKSKRWQADITNIVSPGGVLMLVLVAACAGVVFVLMINVDTEMSLVFAGDLAALFIPILLFGSLSAWRPPQLEVKLQALLGMLDYLESATPTDINLQPMLEVAKAGEGGGLPLDARMMIRFKDAPETFYGVQVQVSINEVQGTQYPYLYAVILYRHDFPADYKSLGLPRRREMVFEPSREGEVVVLVLRQKTTKTSGYHTKEPRRREIVDDALAAARELLRAGKGA
jgi:hypothetical protein